MSEQQNDLDRLQYQANVTERTLEGLAKTLANLDFIKQHGGQVGILPSNFQQQSPNVISNGEQKFFTRAQVEQIRARVVECKQEIEREIARNEEKDKIIKKLKDTCKSELIEIKKDITLHAAMQSNDNEFRQGIKYFLLEIQKEVENSRKENEMLRKQLQTHQQQQQSTKDMIPRSEVEHLLREMIKIRKDIGSEYESFNEYKTKIKKQSLQVKHEILEMQQRYFALESKCKTLENENQALRNQVSDYKNGRALANSARSEIVSYLQALKSQAVDLETVNSSLKLDLSIANNHSLFMPGYELKHSLFVRCIDMHTGGEPLRIIDLLSNDSNDTTANSEQISNGFSNGNDTSDNNNNNNNNSGSTGGIPLELETRNIENITLLKKRQYMKENLDNYRKFLMYEPRGHSDMYGAIIVEADNKETADFGVLFMHNEGYSTMCGHAVIALARYAVDCGKFNHLNSFNNNNNNNINGRDSDNKEMENNEFKNWRFVRIQTPCGIVHCTVEMDESNNKTTGNVSFLSAPGWAEQLNQTIKVDKYGEIKYDIGYGGAYYAILPSSLIGLSVTKSSIKDLIEGGTMISNKVKEQLTSNNGLTNPDDNSLSFLYGTILTENDNNNITIFADRQVDRCPTGSGVIARLAIDFNKNLIKNNERKQFIGPTGAVFNGMIKESGFKYKTKDNCVRVQVSGSAYYSGDSRFYLEENDNLGKGFLIR